MPLAQPDDGVNWTDVAQAVAEGAAAVGTLTALVFFGLQLRAQSIAMRDQRESSLKSLEAVANQIKAQAKQTGYVAEQTHLQMEQTRLLAQQLELVAMTNKSLLYQNVTKEMQQITSIFFREPKLRCYFYEGAELPADPKLCAEVKILSEMFVDFMAFTLNTNVLFNDEERTSWTRYFQYIAENSPAVREFWRVNGAWYEAPVRAVLDPIVHGFPDGQLSEVSADA